MSRSVHVCRACFLLRVTEQSLNGFAGNAILSVHLAVRSLELHMQLGPDAKGWDEDLVSPRLLLLALLPPCCCCQPGFPLLVVTWLPSLGPYMFRKFKLACVWGHWVYKGLEEH